MFEFLENSVPITSQQWSEDTVPLVSISCITYNHENFIRDAIEGFLMQKTTFPVEILIHDDASTDKTASIVREYEEKYPHLIKPIYQTENQYSKRDGSIGRIQRGRARGKYYATCEGDDYWIDPLKLQKQVDFLEENSEYSMCFTNAEVVDCRKNRGNLFYDLYSKLETREYTGNEILKEWLVPTASVVWRMYGNERPPADTRFVYKDNILFLWLAEKGKLMCINEKTVVYRKHNGSVTFRKINFNKWVEHYLAIEENFGRKYEKEITYRISNVYSSAFITGRLGKTSLMVVRDVIRKPRYLFRFMFCTPNMLIKTLFNNIAVR